MFCPDCGNDILDNSRFCFSCGANLSENLGNLTTGVDSKSEPSEIEDTLSDGKTVISDEPSAIDTGRYEIQSTIGKGGMGTSIYIYHLSRRGMPSMWTYEQIYDMVMSDDTSSLEKEIDILKKDIKNMLNEFRNRGI